MRDTMQHSDLVTLAAQAAWADATVWAAVTASPASRSDPHLRSTLHHLHLVQHIFQQAWAGQPLTLRSEAEFAGLADLTRWGRDAHRGIAAFLAQAPDLDRPFREPWTDQFELRFGAAASAHTLGESVLQVMFHTAHHRGQLCARLRALDVEPPTVDLIVWLWGGRYAHLLDGWHDADSIAVDAHKWLNVPYDSAVQFTRHAALQGQVFQNTGAAYLGTPNLEDALHLTPENSRRLRALPAWLTLTAYGAEGYRAMIEASCRCAAQLAGRVRASTAFRLLAPVRMNVVAFTLAGPPASHAEILALLDRLRDGGVTYLTPTTLWGEEGVRAAFSNWRTTAADVERAWAALVHAAGDRVVPRVPSA